MLKSHNLQPHYCSVCARVRTREFENVHNANLSLLCLVDDMFVHFTSEKRLNSVNVLASLINIANERKINAIFLPQSVRACNATQMF